MCGICGIISFRSPEGLEDNLHLMLQSMQHRGTQESQWIKGNIAFGVRRLPIIDLYHSVQPIFNEDQSLLLIGNGQIYNYLELRRELLQKGHKFRTNGDLECILHLYEDYGNDLWNKLRGMWLFAV
jgi:asparagine synthase (glutamine-hydrolysing)